MNVIKHYDVTVNNKYREPFLDILDAWGFNVGERPKETIEDVAVYLPGMKKKEKVITFSTKYTLHCSALKMLCLKKVFKMFEVPVKVESSQK